MSTSEEMTVWAMLLSPSVPHTFPRRCFAGAVLSTTWSPAHAVPHMSTHADGLAVSVRALLRRRDRVSLNQIANECTFNLIAAVLDMGYSLSEVPQDSMRMN